MPKLFLAEFGDPEALARALRALGDRGLRKLDAYTPYSTEVVRAALAAPPSRLPIAILGGGVLGSLGAYALQWLLVAYLYPLNVGGRPPHMPLAFVPITFEMGVLGAAFTAFFGVLYTGKLLSWWHPVFEVDGFESASVDKFWLSVDAADPLFDGQATPALVASFAPLRQLVLEGKW
jgi:hypothetical protein